MESGKYGSANTRRAPVTGIPPGLGLPASGVEAKPDSTGLLLAPGYVGLLASGWWRRQRAV